MTRRPLATNERTTWTMPGSKNWTSSMPTTVVSGATSAGISSLVRTGRAMNESPSCERTTRAP